MVLTLITINNCDNFEERFGLDVQYPSDLVQFHNNVLEYYVNEERDDTNIEQLLQSFQEDVSWSTIDYIIKVRGG
ncbi:hypothetical protein KFZ70_12170 [Tamlana fucoidanivorans]|uniref:Uncharacterized protein n=1 Tax=Allotamlana fucoidanivorans TaxID=2583814 RepID=A0A5C4SLT9_9FLAO|nr:hypothetical protein [Tamlana fucoidanivorans]TNJ44966.1 hypothetical protein FGF67_07350 [Tamlana fucoidanivorans]